MMKKVLFLVLSAFCPLWALAQFSGNGSGTAEDPYQITNADEFFEIRNMLEASYLLMNDIDLTDWIEENSPAQGWVPINEFKGNFDGNGKTIKGFLINRPTSDNIGLFSTIKNASIHDFVLQNPKVTGNDNVGIVAGCASSSATVKIKNIVLINPIVSGNNCVGGIIGKQLLVNTVEIEKNSVILPRITGKCWVGGIIGRINSLNGLSDMFYQYNVLISGIITGEKRVGGILGSAAAYYNLSTMPKLNVTANYCSTAIDGLDFTGGICGSISGGSYQSYNYMYPVISNNHYAGTIHTVGQTGGIVGYETCAPDDLYRDTYNSYKKIVISKNICSGNVYSNDSTSGVFGVLAEWPHSTYKSSISTNNDVITINNNVFCGDSLVAYLKNSHIFRISGNEGTDNYAMSTSSLVVYGNDITVTDNNQQGIGYGKKTLMRRTTYQGFGFDFNDHWSIVDGESFPYIIKQSIPAKIISFTCGNESVITGTAEVENKGQACNGVVYVIVGNSVYKDIVTNGQWAVQLGTISEGQEAKVTVMVDGLLPSLCTIAKAEAGSGHPIPVTDVTDISSLTDAIYANPVTVSKGSTATLTINLKNAQTTNGYSFDLKLPTGVTLAKDNSDEYIYTLSTRHNGHVATVNYKEASGVYGFAVMSLSSKDVKESDGAILTLTLNISDEMSEGDYAVKVQNARYSLSSGATSVAMEDVTSLLTVESYIKGDANGDSMVDIADAVCIVNHIVGKATPSFIESAADANGDGVVDIADAVRIVNLIVGKIDALGRGHEVERNLPEPE